MAYSKKQLIEGLKEQIPLSREKLCRALVIVYSNQTEEEVLKGSTIEENDRGFSSIDADILTKFAKFYMSKGFLSNKQLEIVCRLIPKYASQILDYSIDQGFIRQVSSRRYEIVKKEKNHEVL